MAIHWNGLRPTKVLRSQSLDQSGQMVVESVLILTLTVGLLISAIKVLKGVDVVNKMVTGPWARTAIMIETGTWSNTSSEGRARHPNTGVRSRILDPK